MTIKVTIGFDTKRRKEIFAHVKLTAKEAKDIVQETVAGKSYINGAAFVAKYAKKKTKHARHTSHIP